MSLLSKTILNSRQVTSVPEWGRMGVDRKPKHPIQETPTWYRLRVCLHKFFDSFPGETSARPSGGETPRRRPRGSPAGASSWRCCCWCPAFRRSNRSASHERLAWGFPECRRPHSGPERGDDRASQVPGEPQCGRALLFDPDGTARPGRLGLDRSRKSTLC